MKAMHTSVPSPEVASVYIQYSLSRLPVFERPHQEAQKETPSYTLHYIITLDEIRLYCTVLHDST